MTLHRCTISTRHGYFNSDINRSGWTAILKRTSETEVSGFSSVELDEVFDSTRIMIETLVAYSTRLHQSVAQYSIRIRKYKYPKRPSLV